MDKTCNNGFNYKGFQIIESNNMVNIETVKKERKFVERIFSLHPLKKYKFIQIEKPSQEILILEKQKQVYAHPEIIKKLIKNICETGGKLL